MTFVVFLFGLIVGVIGMMLWNFKGKNNIRLLWTDYLLVALFGIFATVAVIFANTFIEESAPSAAWSSILIFGISAIVVLGVMVQLVRRRN